MNERETEAYLKRIGYEDEIKTDRNCLEKLMEHQLLQYSIRESGIF